MKKIGFIGVGTMGFPMASNLLRKGHQLSFFDPYVIENTKNELIKLGSAQTSSIKELCLDQDFIISMLPIGENVKDVSLGADSIINQENTNLIYIDMSTILPADTIYVSKKLEQKNIEMFDAPVARLVNNAIDGTLLIMVGGNKDKFKFIEDVLKCMGSDVVFCGPIGSGSKMKIINNYMSIVSNIITAETLSLVHKSGIDQKLAIDLMSTTAAGKGHMNQTYPNKVLKGDTKAGFTNALATKDLGLAIQHAKDLNFNLQLGATAKEIYDESLVEISSKDWTAMYEYILKKAKG